MSEHTKDKWGTVFHNETSEDGEKKRMVYVTSKDAGEVICRVFGNPIISIQEANARLIAAAPVLVAALETAEKELEQRYGAQEGSPMDRLVLKIIKDALAKVK